MKIWNFDVALHWRDSFACEFVTDQLRAGWVTVNADTLFKFGGLVIIVSNINKINRSNRGVPKAGLRDASSDDAGTYLRSTDGQSWYSSIYQGSR